MDWMQITVRVDVERLMEPNDEGECLAAAAIHASACRRSGAERLPVGTGQHPCRKAVGVVDERHSAAAAVLSEGHD